MPPRMKKVRKPRAVISGMVDENDCFGMGGVIARSGIRLASDPQRRLRFAESDNPSRSKADKVPRARLAQPISNMAAASFPKAVINFAQDWDFISGDVFTHRSGIQPCRSILARICPRHFSHQTSERGGVFVAHLFRHAFNRHPSRFNQHSGTVQSNAMYERHRALARCVSHTARQRSLRHREFMG